MATEKDFTTRVSERVANTGEGLGGCLIVLLIIGLIIGGIACLFIHPLLTLLAGILIAIVWHGFRTGN